MATTASPTVVRSNSRRQTAYPSTTSERHQRTPSSTVRSPTSGSDSHRSEYTSRQPQGLEGVARRDYETSNLARTPGSRRSESRDRSYAPPPASMRTEASRAPHRNDSRSGHSRYSSDAPRPPGSAGHGGSVRHRDGAAQEATPPVKRRTTVDAQTGTWTLGKTIGAGSMGKVKLAKNLNTGEQVAIKIVPRQSTDEHHTVRERERADHSKEVRTAREAAIVTLLNHPYICGMRDVVRTSYHWYMLFEYVNGGQMLDFIISHGRLKEKQARKFGRQIASALDYCHKNSIVHRDLKIENILISKTGDIKIIDFGLSNLFSPRHHLKTFCGSLYFAAPELLQARQYTGPEVDIWSFGIVLYVLVCGKVPFDDQSMPQLHAKIKKGIVDYPNWLSAECKSLLSRMLVTDPKLRTSLSEIMAHPWMTKGYNTPPENYLPHREPLQLPLDHTVVEKMTGFDFGSSEYITRELTKVIESEDYQYAVGLYNRETLASTPGGERKRGVFDFYRRRNSISRDTLPNLSAEAVPLGSDPTNAYSPLISIYYLVREKQERERMESNPGALALPTSPGETLLKMPNLSPPEAAHVNPHAYELLGEKATGGRSRARARTHGEDELDVVRKAQPAPALSEQPSPALAPSPVMDQTTSAKKESMAGGLLRRLSTRRGRESQRSDHRPAPSLQLQPPADAAAPPRKSFSVRKSHQNKDSASPMIHSAGSQPQQTNLLHSPASAGVISRTGSKLLGRSTSVNSAENRRRQPRGTVSESETTPVAEPPLTSGSDRSSLAAPRVKINEPPVLERKEPATPRSAASRTKSLGHARRESIQARRARRGENRQSNLLEETDQDLVAEETDGGEVLGEMKPVFLKGLFSVSTTSNKPLSFIRADIIRVLKQLGVDYTEVRGGFSCSHAPSIDLHKAAGGSPSSPDTPAITSPGHRRRISFGGFKGGDRDRDREREREEFRESEKTTRHTRRTPPDASFTNSEYSDEEKDAGHRKTADRDRVAGETTTHVQNDLGEHMVLKFEIFVVKVPLFSLHGIQFKKVAGGTWQYKNMAQKILHALRL